MNTLLIKFVTLFAVTALMPQDKVLDYQKLEALVIQYNPDLKALAKNVESHKGNVLQASLRLNPELGFESGAGGDPETAAQLSQTFELGRKRQKRTRVAELELESTQLSYTIKKLEILKEARSVFIDILLSQQVVNLKKEMVVIAEEFLQSVQTRVKAGRLSPAEAARAQIALTSQQVELNRTQRNLKNHWRQLASFWGNNTPDFSRADGNLDSTITLPPEKLVGLLINKSPQVAEKNIEIQTQQAVVNVEQAKRIPDLTVSAGIKKTDVPDNTYQVGFSIPLQVFNRNQGTIQATNALLDQIMEEKNALEIRLRAEIALVYSDLKTIIKEIEALKTTILPEAHKAYQIINDGYLQGKFDFLDVVDAQSTLYDAEENLWIALSDFNKSVAEIEMLLGQPLLSSMNSNKE